MSNDKILKSLSDGLEEVKQLLKSKLEKGKKFPIGTVHNWGGKDFKKIDEGNWEEVKKPKKMNPDNMESSKMRSLLAELNSVLERMKTEDNPRKYSELDNKADELQEKIKNIENKKWVYGTRTNEWELVGPEDRDYKNAISQEEMKKIGKEKAKDKYLSPSFINESK